MNYLDALMGKEVIVDFVQPGKNDVYYKTGVLLGYDANYLVVNVQEGSKNNSPVYRARLFGHHTVREVRESE